MFFMLFFTFRLYPARWIAGRFWNAGRSSDTPDLCSLFFFFLFFLIKELRSVCQTLSHCFRYKGIVRVVWRYRNRVSSSSSSKFADL